MEPSSENLPADHPHGLWTLVTTAISLVLLLVGGLLIQPRLVERRTRIDDQFILTPAEVAALPSETLVVVLDRCCYKGPQTMGMVCWQILRRWFHKISIRE